MMGPGPMGMGPGMGPGIGPGMMGPMQIAVNPATNDAPLEFNTNKNKPPMPVAASKDSCIGLKKGKLIVKVPSFC